VNVMGNPTVDATAHTFTCLMLESSYWVMEFRGVLFVCRRIGIRTSVKAWWVSCSIELLIRCDETSQV
jgi:hypothetical protein